MLFEELRGLNEEASAQLRIKQIKTTTKTAQTIQHDKKCCGCGFTSGWTKFNDFRTVFRIVLGWKCWTLGTFCPQFISVF